MRHVALTSVSREPSVETNTSRRNAKSLTVASMEANREKLKWLLDWRCPQSHDLAKCFVELVAAFCPGIYFLF